MTCDWGMVYDCFTNMNGFKIGWCCLKTSKKSLVFLGLKATKAQFIGMTCGAYLPQLAWLGMVYGKQSTHIFCDDLGIYGDLVWIVIKCWYATVMAQKTVIYITEKNSYN